MQETPEFFFCLSEDANNDQKFLPTKAEPGSTGFDCRACLPGGKPLLIEPGEYVKIPLGIRALSPEGYWLELHGRSSTFIKKNIIFLIGIIDNSYTGNIMLCGRYEPNFEQDLVINHGDPIAQLIPRKIQEMGVSGISLNDYEEALNNKVLTRKRGDSGGFGSTG